MGLMGEFMDLFKVFYSFGLAGEMLVCAMPFVSIADFRLMRLGTDMVLSEHDRLLLDTVDDMYDLSRRYGLSRNPDNCSSW
jgi:hypothetical protein